VYGADKFYKSRAEGELWVMDLDDALAKLPQ
jgi:hypothetical protein